MPDDAAVYLCGEMTYTEGDGEMYGSIITSESKVSPKYLEQRGILRHANIGCVSSALLYTIMCVGRK